MSEVGPEVELDISTEEEDGITYVHLHTSSGCYLVPWMRAMQLASHIMRQACYAAEDCGADEDTIITVMNASVDSILGDDSE